jgi:hypothetical protein
MIAGADGSHGRTCGTLALRQKKSRAEFAGAALNEQTETEELDSPPAGEGEPDQAGPYESHRCWFVGGTRASGFRLNTATR